VFDDLDPGPSVSTAAVSSRAPSADHLGDAALPEGVPQVIHAEMGLGWGEKRTIGDIVARAIVVIVIAALAAGAIYFLSHRGQNTDTTRRNGVAARRHHNGGNQGHAGKPSPASSAPAAAPSASAPAVGTSPSAGSTSSSGVVPVAGWIPYADPTVGWSISYPPGWEPQARASHVYDFTDPNGGRYLRVAWTTTPGPNPKARWKQYSKSFATRYPDAHTLGISKNFTFKGWKASAWEYTYTDGGSLLHAVDLALVNGTYGFALNFQTHDTDWASSQDIFRAFKRSFQPPS
jgi:hypothetical protein